MGRIRTAEIKTAARNLIRRYPDKFATGFENNKELLNEFKLGESKRMRNQLAGYITRLVKNAKKTAVQTSQV